MVLVNPTDSVVSVVFDGVTYSIDPKGKSRDLPADVASRWTAVHSFLTVDEVAEVKEVKETKKAKKEEVEDKE